jgi:hypothetical protein
MAQVGWLEAPSVVAAFGDEVFDLETVEACVLAETRDAVDRVGHSQSFAGYASELGSGHLFDEAYERNSAGMGFGGELGFEFGLEIEVDHAGVRIAFGALAGGLWRVEGLP